MREAWHSARAHGTELLVLIIIDNESKSLLCVGCYCPPSQGTVALDFLTVNLGTNDDHRRPEPTHCSGRFPHLVVSRRPLQFVNLPIHSSGSSLFKVVTDLPSDAIQCLLLDFVGTSDHMAVIAKILMMP